MADDCEPIMSPLCRHLESEGRTVRIEICGDGDGGWRLEVVDELGNSTVWDDPFPTDHEALAEVLATVDEEGIAVLVGPAGGLEAPSMDYCPPQPVTAIVPGRVLATRYGVR